MRDRKSIRWMMLVGLPFLAGGVCEGSESCELPTAGPVEEGKYRYILSKEATALYPQAPAEGSEQAAVFPYYYEQFYTDLGATIEHFTTLSLQRGGAGTSAAVSVICDQAVITLEGSGDLGGFAAAHQAFMEAGAAGLNGAYACSRSSSPPPAACHPDHRRCWDPNPGPQPWAFMLPLGLPIHNQKATLLLNYPPSDALCGRDYLNNFTMARFASVLESIGVPDDEIPLYETILDSRPIAAPGSGQASCMPDITKFFRDKEGDSDYVDRMLAVLVGGGGGETRPVFVLGGPAQETWQEIIGSPVETGQGGVATIDLGSGEASVPWVAANHPDVTAYNCCAGDMSAKCQEKFGDETSTDLVKDELSDLANYCAIREVAGGTDPEAALEQCSAAWCQDSYPKVVAGEESSCPAEAQEEICIRLRLDYNRNSEGSQCACREAAQAFCAQYDNNGCPNGGARTSCQDFNEKHCKASGPSWTDCPRS